MATPKGALTPIARRALVEAYKDEAGREGLDVIMMWGETINQGLEDERVVLSRVKHVFTSPHPKTVRALESKGLIVKTEDHSGEHFGGPVKYALTVFGREVAEGFLANGAA